MKIYSIVPILFFLLAMLFSAVFSKAQGIDAGSMEKLLVGKWKIEPSTIPSMVDITIENVKKQNEEQGKAMEGQKEMIGQMIANTVLEYKSDKSFYIDVPTTPQSGTWKISEDGKKVIRIGSDGKERINEITELTKDKMSLINERNQKVSYVRL